VICSYILIYYSTDLRSLKPEIMLICGDLRFSGRPPWRTTYETGRIRAYWLYYYKVIKMLPSINKQ